MAKKDYIVFSLFANSCITWEHHEYLVTLQLHANLIEELQVLVTFLIHLSYNWVHTHEWSFDQIAYRSTPSINWFSDCITVLLPPIITFTLYKSVIFNEVMTNDLIVHQVTITFKKFKDSKKYTLYQLYIHSNWVILFMFQQLIFIHGFLNSDLHYGIILTSVITVFAILFLIRTSVRKPTFGLLIITIIIIIVVFFFIVIIVITIIIFIICSFSFYFVLWLFLCLLDLWQHPYYVRSYQHSYLKILLHYEYCNQWLNPFCFS